MRQYLSTLRPFNLRSSFNHYYDQKAYSVSEAVLNSEAGFSHLFPPQTQKVDIMISILQLRKQA